MSCIRAPFGSLKFCAFNGIPTKIQKRPLFNLLRPTHKYTEHRLLGYTLSQMYTIVSEIQHYKLFVPWCVDSRIISTLKQGSIETQVAELKVGFKHFQESYKSKVTLTQNVIKADSFDSSVFDILKTSWTFQPIPANDTITTNSNMRCALKFECEFRFKSLLYNQMSDLVLERVGREMVGAFEIRAFDLYGKASCESKLINN